MIKIKTIAFTMVIALFITSAQGTLLCFFWLRVRIGSCLSFSHMICCVCVLAMYRAVMVGAAVARERQLQSSDSDSSLVSVILLFW
jgi:hypothetical protein